MRVTLKMADRSIKHLGHHGRGGQLHHPVDFVVLHMEKDKDIPIILRRPFLVTGFALINVQKGELKLRFKAKRSSSMSSSP